MNLGTLVAAFVCLLIGAWWLSLLFAEDPRDLREGDGLNYYRLGQWLEENMPDVYKIGDPDSVREKLNEITGLDVSPNDEIEVGSGRFLEALKKQRCENG